MDTSNIRNLKLVVLSAVSQVVGKALDLENALGEVLGILSETLAMKRATITLLDENTGLLTIAASHGLTPEERSRGVYELNEGVTGIIFQTAKPFFVPDVNKEPLFLDKTGTRRIERRTISFIGVPIMHHAHPIGVLSVDRLFGEEVSVDEDIDFLTVVATLIAQFITLNESVKAQVDELKRENVALKHRVSREKGDYYIVGKSLAMQDVQRQLERVAPTRATVLLLGESGVGKTLVARIIHRLSDRENKPFIKINCAAIPETLLESELFGHEKGAFTGADRTRPGRLEEADNGTLFLDEIGEIPLSLQSKLLRAIQEKEFERLGSNKTLKADVRFIAATNRDLGKLASEGLFRPDLYYRLSVFPILVPPLRDRSEDILELLNHFARKMAHEYSRTLSFSPAALELIRHYSWPGNVREMENLMERLVILADKERIEAGFLAQFLDEREQSNSRDIASTLLDGIGGAGGSGTLKEMEKDRVIAALKRNKGIQYKAADELGLTPRQMGYRVRKYGLETLIARERVRGR